MLNYGQYLGFDMMDQPTAEKSNVTVPWKSYLTITAESVLTFYLATFCIAFYFAQHGIEWILPSILVVMLYIFVIIACIKRVIEKLSMAALMLVIPIAPLLVLIMVVSLIPVLEKL